MHVDVLPQTTTTCECFSPHKLCTTSVESLVYPFSTTISKLNKINKKGWLKDDNTSSVSVSIGFSLAPIGTACSQTDLHHGYFLRRCPIIIRPSFGVQLTEPLKPILKANSSDRDHKTQFWTRIKQYTDDKAGAHFVYNQICFFLKDLPPCFLCSHELNSSHRRCADRETWQWNDIKNLGNFWCNLGHMTQIIRNKDKNSWAGKKEVSATGVKHNEDPWWT